MSLPYIYQAKSNENNEVTGYPAFARIVSRLQDVLFEKYGYAFTIYSTDNSFYELWTILEEDVKENSDEIDHVAQIFEKLEAKTYEYDREGETPQFKVIHSVHNHVYAYTKAGVAFARIPAFDENANIMSYNCVLAKNDEALMNFLRSINERLWLKSQNEVLVFTDTMHGFNQEHQPINQEISRDDVVLEPKIKEDIYAALDQFFDEDRSFFKMYNIPYKRGILLYGPPGNGKTSLVKAIANTIKAPVAYWQITEYTNSDSISTVFSSASRLSPMILVIEDIDSLPVGVRSFFLNTLDGATSKEGIFLIGTTNYPEKIDPGLMNRAGRFDRSYEISLPNGKMRNQFIHQLGFNHFLEEDEISQLSAKTKGFSFAQIKELFVSAALEWHQKQTLHLDEIIQGMKKEHKKSKQGEWWDDQDEQVGFR
ncbi:ATPase [Alkalihalobacillus alcalophilus ATCC 27647 = CGMCC 1.3604]|uniref:ATPase n=1 Tax=Alkalihalobacillus alcalophilus ATCC 27647 = CGMCC 1.3604 TaxID=1218173 RepID=A0A094WJN7_ALKAL|nr:ATP-binding protein [Alkalihalobacillus alcalophilus]KGA97994.1 ATPase [Alkalihalobacillus alcalophilus ATCC 27647 = CGMCC 1.3604]MED1561886.1 ATP-binding protein [Alkalihalobacillus alcalophilus]THG90441.1 ATPase [Alkalihalobacillus alcalophilus ATCC 27647 = CGMCC 1.3604]